MPPRGARGPGSRAAAAGKMDSQTPVGAGCGAAKAPEGGGAGGPLLGGGGRGGSGEGRGRAGQQGLCAPQPRARPGRAMSLVRHPLGH